MISDDRVNDIVGLIHQDGDFLKLFKKHKEQLLKFVNDYKGLSVEIKDSSEREMVIGCLGTTIKAIYLVSIDENGDSYGRIRFEHQVKDKIDVIKDLYFDKYGFISDGFPFNQSMLNLTKELAQGQILFMVLDGLLNSDFFKPAKLLYPELR